MHDLFLQTGIRHAQTNYAPDPAGGAHDAPQDSPVDWGRGSPFLNPYSSSPSTPSASGVFMGWWGLTPPPFEFEVK